MQQQRLRTPTRPERVPNSGGSSVGGTRHPTAPVRPASSSASKSTSKPPSSSSASPSSSLPPSTSSSCSSSSSSSSCPSSPNLEHVVQKLAEQVQTLTERLNQSSKSPGSNVNPGVPFPSSMSPSFTPGPLNFQSPLLFSGAHPYCSIASSTPVPVSSIISQVVASNDRIAQVNQNMVWYASMSQGPPRSPFGFGVPFGPNGGPYGH